MSTDSKSNSEKEYLQKLINNLKDAKKKDKRLLFKIIEVKEKGFSVKVGGLFAFVHFSYMPWCYSSIDYWLPVSKYLIGKAFYCKIHKISEDPISILLDATEQKFGTIKLKEQTKYSGVIVYKAKYGLFVDMGYHFDWKYGSMLGLVHKSELVDVDQKETLSTGNEISITFQGYNEEGKMILSNNNERKKWLTGELNKFIGTIQKIKVIITEEQRKEFYVNEIHKASISFEKSLYEGHRIEAKAYYNSLEHNQEIECEVLKISKRKDKFVLKLLLDSK